MPAFAFAENYLKKEIKKNGKSPFEGIRLAACLHVSKETAVLIHSLVAFGMKIHLVAANPLSSQEDIAAFLSDAGVEVSARRGETAGEYLRQISLAGRSDPQLIVDDGGELHVAYAESSSRSCFGGTDETTSGTHRLKALYENGLLKYPVIPVNEAKTKHVFDNKYGTGQSAVDGLIRATGLLLAGKVVVVAGYGWVGSGVALRLKGLGAHVIITEVNPIKALEAHLDGFEVLMMSDAVKKADIFLTCTGQTSVIAEKHFKGMKDGSIVGNVGHFDLEIDVRALFRMGAQVEHVRENVAKVRFSNGKSVFLLCQGRVINLAAAEGHPPEVMQLSFANQLLSLNYLVTHRKSFSKRRGRLLQFPEEIDELVSGFALRAFKLKIDILSKAQQEYARSFNRSTSER